jgi:CRP-like cAMP-binding protein
LLTASNAVPEFQAVLLRFIHTFTVQLASTVLANSAYLVEQRLARWILMSHDRMETASFPMTHEFMATMLGVRRAGVTDAIHSLEARGVIRARRGNVQVLNRIGLQDLASDSYGHAEREYKRLICP